MTYTAPQCDAPVGGGTITFLCDLGRGHDGPHRATENAKSVRERAAWEAAQRGEPSLSDFQGPPQTTAERYTSGATPPPGQSPLVGATRMLCQACLEERHLECSQRAEIIAVMYDKTQPEVTFFCACFQGKMIEHGVDPGFAARIGDIPHLEPLQPPVEAKHQHGPGEAPDFEATRAPTQTPLGFGPTDAQGQPYEGGYGGHEPGVEPGTAGPPPNEGERRAAEALRQVMEAEARDPDLHPPHSMTVPTKQREGDQPLPKPNHEPPIQDRIVEKTQALVDEGSLPQEVADTVRVQMEQSKQVGIRRYGTPLQAWNGRDVLQDLSEELRDAFVYVHSIIEARDATRDRMIAHITQAVTDWADDYEQQMGTRPEVDLRTVAGIAVDTIFRASAGPVEGE